MTAEAAFSAWSVDRLVRQLAALSFNCNCTARCSVHQNAGAARFIDKNTIETSAGLRISADKIIICTGGESRLLLIPRLRADRHPRRCMGPDFGLAIHDRRRAGATGVQVASIFNAFGSRVQLFEAGPRILATEDADISAAAAIALRQSGIAVHESFGTIEAFAKTPAGVRMVFTKNGARLDAEASLAVVAVGWVADTKRLNVAAEPTPPTEGS
ncbi:FAD-dependent oxidoreductase [Bradyrhizobium pachyrhizi]|uniref:FAD-dependent oxidoreductase n=1 Tax=Bradyrhizobium TaxID=374 RepID=UPI00067AED3D|nr:MULTISPECIES: FAD-dependent oxidoreductase [Bradyrhizobium]WFU57774.1 FAD-dependent oxidoreductase [Bradyrhizobium pachyrhizi]WOH83322.1 FAD-dependent oxidoreductase [Bradyrhizobium sp. BEA-2-5]